MGISYKEYVQNYANGCDTRTNWIWWKVFCGMSLKEATKAAYKEYKPLGKD